VAESDLAVELQRLRHDFEDLRQEVQSVRAAAESGSRGRARRRGVLTTAGTTAESVLKCVVRREGLDKQSKPADKLMLDKLLTLLGPVLPPHVQVHLRTVQAWRNVGSHDKGDIDTVSESTLQNVVQALSEVVTWFFEKYGNEAFDASSAPPAAAPAPRQDNDAALREWRELFWWTMRTGTPRPLDIKALEAVQRRLGLTDDRVQPLRAAFRRDVEQFRQSIADACEDGALEDYEAEGLEHLRLEACVSEREAKELMQATRPAGLTIDAGISLAWVRLESAASAPPRPAQPIPAAAPVTNPAGLAWKAPWMSSYGEDDFGRWAAVSIAAVEHKFRWCPPGRFLMGSPASEYGRFDDEGPQHEVELTLGFWMGEAPVTQRQWEAVAGSNPSHFKGPDQPVEQISWNDAQAWMSWANTRTGGLGLRFPTEAEWEYASRAGTTGATYRGGNDAATLDAIAWYIANSGDTTHPVKQKAPNPWGLYDTLGNVYEWCAGDKRKYTRTRKVNPHGGLGDGRVGRGGSWGNVAQTVRAAYRSARTSDYRFDYLGFRLARGQ